MDRGKRISRPRAQPAGARADEDRRAEQFLSAQLCQPVGPVLANHVVYRLLAVEHPGEQFGILGIGHRGARSRMLLSRARCRHSASPFYGKNRGLCRLSGWSGWREIRR